MMISELVMLYALNTIIIFVILYFILKHIRETKKFYHKSKIEWDRYQENIKNLEEKLSKYHLMCKLDKVCFIGIGGGGTNILEDISKFDNRHNFIHINSDLQSLKLKTSKYKILLGYDKKAGLGCGGKEQCGKNLIDNDIKNKLFKLTKDEKIIYIVSTLGGGIGSGATPEILEYLKTLNKEIVVFVTIPFNFEGKMRKSVATNATAKIKSIVNGLIILKNDDLIDNNKSKSLGIKETFKITSDVIYKRIADGM